MNLIRMVLAAGCLWATAVLADPPPGYPFVGFDAGLKAAHTSGKPIFLYFGRYGCAWCEHTNKTTFSDAALKKLYSDNYELVYVDAESGKRLTLPSGERITTWKLWASLPRLGEYLYKTLPHLRTETLGSDIAEWFWRLPVIFRQSLAPILVYLSI